DKAEHKNRDRTQSFQPNTQSHTSKQMTKFTHITWLNMHACNPHTHTHTHSHTHTHTHTQACISAGPLWCGLSSESNADNKDLHKRCTHAYTHTYTHTHTHLTHTHTWTHTHTHGHTHTHIHTHTHTHTYIHIHTHI